ncbi:MAG: tetratricopeptide repeat protein [Anaerolineae bacterium]
MSDWSGFDLDLRILMGLGLRAFDDGDMKTAYRYFSKALAKEPNNVEVLLWKAGTSPDPMESLSCLERAARLDPANKYVQEGLAWARMRVAQARARVMMEGEESAEADAVEAHRHYERGIAYEKEGMEEDAIIAFQIAIGLHPDFVEAHRALGRVYRKLGQDDKAIEEFKKVLEIEPDCIESLTNLSLIYREQGRLLDALIFSEEVLRLKPNHPEARQVAESICDSLFRVLGY